MHKNFKRFIGLTLIMLSLGTLAYAEAPKCEIVTDSQTGVDTLYVSGTSTEPAGTRVTVMLVKPEKNYTDIVNDGATGLQAVDALEAISAAYVTTDADGKLVYNWQYDMHEDCLSGEYTVRTKVYGVGTAEETKITFQNKLRIQAAFEAARDNTDTMENILVQYGKDLDFQSGVTFVGYPLGDVYRDYIISSMDNERVLGRITDGATMQQLFKDYVSVATIGANISAVEKKEVKDLVETNYGKIGISDAEFAAYTNLVSDSKKEAAIANMVSLLGVSATPSQLVTAFNAGVTYAQSLSDDIIVDDDNTSSYVPSTPSSVPPKMDPVVTQSGSFDDIANVTWATDAIEALVKHGVVNGKSERLFCPNDNVKREEFVKMIVEAFKLTVDTKDITFTDVATDSWYYNYVKVAVSSGIVNGISATEFGAGQNISRQDMAVMIQRAAVKTGVEILIVEADKQFNDSDNIAEYAKLPVKQLAQAGVVNGDENGNFNPANSATRAHAAVMLYNLLYK